MKISANRLSRPGPLLTRHSYLPAALTLKVLTVRICSFSDTCKYYYTCIEFLMSMQNINPYRVAHYARPNQCFCNVIPQMRINLADG